MWSTFTCYANYHFTVNNVGPSKNVIRSKIRSKIFKYIFLLKINFFCIGNQSLSPDKQNIPSPITQK